MEDNRYNIAQSDFELIQKDTKLADKPFSTKPTTFAKDAFKRFCKNKSSIVAAIIIGILILLAIFLPILSPKNIKYISNDEAFLAPKLFKSGTGFWDGTRKYKNIVYDNINETPAGFYKPAVKLLKKWEEKIDVVSNHGKGGYVVFLNEKMTPTYLSSYPTLVNKDGNYVVNIKLYNKENYNNSKQGEYAIYLKLENPVIVGEEKIEMILLQDYSKNYGEISLDISNALEKAGIEDDVKASLYFELKPGEVIVNKETDKKTLVNKTYIMIETVLFNADSSVSNYDELTKNISFSDANAMVLLKKDDSSKEKPLGMWDCTGTKNIHNVTVTKCDFRFDTYEKAYGVKEAVVYMTDLESYKKAGLCNYDKSDVVGTFKVLDEACPVREVKAVDQIHPVSKNPTSFKCEVNGYSMYKHGGTESVYSKAPKFLLGTDVNGYDLIKKSFSGLRTSLFIGFATAAFCFVFGLIWGSLSGYFGGTVDILMERFCEILGGVPWIVVMTLAVLYLGNNLGTFFLALCLTGWMGTASRTRTQFYRYKGREYVLASRTLGSSDFRLIFKHILPNSMGTIITSSVLMVTSVIMSESTLAFLNLGLQGVDSFGVMMSNNQQYLQVYPVLVLFPAFIISLLMISFNLFGNGLRDAFNPSLKGSE